MNNIEEELLKLIEEGRNLHYHHSDYDVNFPDYVHDRNATAAYDSWKRKVKMFAERNLTDHPLYNDLLKDIKPSIVSDSDSVCNILTDIYNDLIAHN